MVQLQSEATDTKIVEVSEPSYNLVLVQPLDGTSYTFSTSQTDKIFRLPNSVYNLSRSFLEYDILFAATGAATFIHVLLKPAIARLQLLSSGNFQFVDLQNFDVFYKVCALACMRREVYLSKDAVLAAATILTAVNETCLLAPANVAFSTAISAYTINSQYTRRAGAVSGTAYTIETGSANGLARQQMISSGAGNGATGPIAFRVSIPLGLIPDCIFAQDRDLFFNDLNQLVCTMASTNQLGSVSDSQTDPASTPTAIATAVTLSNFNLRLAVERQVDNVELTKSKFFAGKLKMICPYVLCYSESMGAAASTSYSSTRQFNRGLGKSLLRVWNVPIVSANSGRLSANTDNVSINTGLNGVGITSVQTQLDTNYIQPNAVTCADGYSYRYQAHMLDGTAVGGRRQFELHWFFVDAFSGSNEPLWVSQQKLGELSGLELSNEPRLYTSQWVMPGTIANTLVQFATVQRELSLTQAGPQWM